jgi:hypothetical protein
MIFTQKYLWIEIIYLENIQENGDRKRSLNRKFTECFLSLFKVFCGLKPEDGIIKTK